MFAKAFADCMEFLNLSSDKLALQMKVPMLELQDVLDGHKDTELSKIEDVCEFLNITVAVTYDD